MSRATLTEEYLVTNRTKRAARGWKAVCPSCSGNDLWYTLDNNSAYCFECGASYRVGDGEKSDPGVYEDIIPSLVDVESVRRVYTTAQRAYHDNLEKVHIEYLLSRGLSSSIIRDLLIGYCSEQDFPLYHTNTSYYAGIADKSGRPLLRGRIVFPYLVNAEVTDMRGRSVEANARRYVSPRVQAHVRGAIYPFNYDRAVARAASTRRVIVTEGEIKTILADMCGHAAVGLPGMLTWRQGLLDFVGHDFIAVFDNSSDPFDRVRVDKAVTRLASRLPNLHVVVLPLLGAEKQDIDSFIMHPKGGEKFFNSLLDGAVPFGQYRKLRRF